MERKLFAALHKHLIITYVYTYRDTNIPWEYNSGSTFSLSFSNFYMFSEMRDFILILSVQLRLQMATAELLPN